MLTDSSLAEILFRQSPVIAAAVLALILALTRMGSRAGAAMLAALAALMLGASALLQAFGVSYVIDQRHELGLREMQDWLDIINWGSTILTGLAFLLLALAFVTGSSSQRPPAAPHWPPPPPPPPGAGWPPR